VGVAGALYIFLTYSTYKYTFMYFSHACWAALHYVCAEWNRADIKAAKHTKWKREMNGFLPLCLRGYATCAASRPTRLLTINKCARNFGFIDTYRLTLKLFIAEETRKYEINLEHISKNKLLRTRFTHRVKFKKINNKKLINK